jgi:hypothetical protein
MIKFLILTTLFLFCLPGFSQVKDNSVYPTCDKNGQLLCPDGYEPSCKEEEDLVKTEPKCFFYIDKHVPCCMKFAGIKKLDLGLEKLMLGPTSMVKVIGGGETYTLNREAIFCKKIADN